MLALHQAFVLTAFGINNKDFHVHWTHTVLCWHVVQSCESHDLQCLRYEFCSLNMSFWRLDIWPQCQSFVPTLWSVLSHVNVVISVPEVSTIMPRHCWLTESGITCYAEWAPQSSHHCLHWVSHSIGHHESPQHTYHIKGHSTTQQNYANIHLCVRTLLYFRSLLFQRGISCLGMYSYCNGLV